MLSLAVLRQRNFRLLLITRICGMFAMLVNLPAPQSAPGIALMIALGAACYALALLLTFPQLRRSLAARIAG